jgi:hypothetical protein
MRARLMTEREFGEELRREYTAAEAVAPVLFRATRSLSPDASPTACLRGFATQSRLGVAWLGAFPVGGLKPSVAAVGAVRGDRNDQNPGDGIADRSRVYPGVRPRFRAPAKAEFRRYRHLGRNQHYELWRLAVRPVQVQRDAAHHVHAFPGRIRLERGVQLLLWHDALLQHE